MTKEDLACLNAGEFLNDVIIDFYLKSVVRFFVHPIVPNRSGFRSGVELVAFTPGRFLLLQGVGGPVCERSHVFSSFFYKQLSRRRAAGENHAPSIP